jgi:NTE family protein
MRALVLGGGGVIGVAWETGLVAGLADGGIDLRDADVIVGTSAGSLIGTRLAAGQDLREPPVGAATIEPPIPEGGPDLASLGKIFALWTAADPMNEALCAEIGALAVAARTADVAALIEATGGAVGIDVWPDRDLRITAVDIETGGFMVHTAKTGARLPEAIASSCSVPGMFPPVPIAGRRYMDGGVRSGTNADVLLDSNPARALIVAPICAASAPIGVVAERSLDAEVAALRAAGTQVVTVLPGAREIAAFGNNLMDPTRVEASRDAGYAQGLKVAREEAAIWSA